MELDQIILDLEGPRQVEVQPRTPEHWESLVTPTTSPFPKEETDRDTPLIDLCPTPTLSSQPETPTTTTLVEGIMSEFRTEILKPFKELEKETHVVVRQLKCQAISLDNLLGRMHRRLPGLSPPRQHITHPVAAPSASSAPSREPTSPRRSIPEEPTSPRRPTPDNVARVAPYICPPGSLSGTDLAQTLDTGGTDLAQTSNTRQRRTRRPLHLSTRESLLSQPGQERIRPPTRQYPDGPPSPLPLSVWPSSPLGRDRDAIKRLITQWVDDANRFAARDPQATPANIDINAELKRRRLILQQKAYESGITVMGFNDTPDDFPGN